VLDGVTLTLPPCGLFGLCGPNGAGKSTLLGIIGGSVPPARGRVLLDGEDVTRLFRSELTAARQQAARTLDRLGMEVIGPDGSVSLYDATK